MDMELTSVCSPSPIAEGIVIAILLAPFIPMIARSRHRAAFLAIIAVMAALSMGSTTMRILTYFAPDDFSSMVTISGLITALALTVRLLRGPDRLARLGTVS